jgi:hypothetical protein
MVSEDLQGEEIGWLLNKNCVSGTGKKGADEMETHRGAGGDEQAVRTCWKAIGAAQEFRQFLAEVSIALFGAILEEFRVVSTETFFSSPAHQLQWQKRKLRIAEAQINEARRDIKLRYLQRCFQITRP